MHTVITLNEQYVQNEVKSSVKIFAHQRVDSPGHDEEGHEEVGDGERHDEEVGRRLQHLLL